MTDLSEGFLEINNGVYESGMSECEIGALWTEFQAFRPDLYELILLPYDQRTEEEWRGIHTELHLWLANKYAKPHEPIPALVMKTKIDMDLFWCRYLAPDRYRGEFNG